VNAADIGLTQLLRVFFGSGGQGIGSKYGYAELVIQRPPVRLSKSGIYYFSKVVSHSFSIKPCVIKRTAGSCIKSELPPEVKPRNPFSSNKTSLVIRTSGSHITKTRLPFLAGKSHVHPCLAGFA
jgi:hypothetical protein